MEDLVRGLRNLGLHAPSPAQLLEVLDDDVETRQRLVRVLAFSAVEPDELGEDGGQGSSSSAAAALMGQDLLQEAVGALLDNFSSAMSRQREALRCEEAILREMTASNWSSSTQINGKSGKNATRKVKLAPRKALLARQEAALLRIATERSIAEKDYKGYRPRLVFDGEVSFFSRKRVSELKRVQCRDLATAPRRYENTILLCRIITQILPYVGATFVVEDPAGDAITVSISHLSSNLNLSIEAASQELPIGTVVAIKEPLLSSDHQARAGPCSGKSDVGIRIDCPTDLVVLDCETDEVRSLLDGVTWANELPLSAPSALTLPSWLGLRHLQISAAPEHKEQDSVSNVKGLLDRGRRGAAWRMLHRLGAQREHDSLELTAMKAYILHAGQAWEDASAAFQKAASILVKQGMNGRKSATSLNRPDDFGKTIFDLTFEGASTRCRLRSAQESQGLTQDDVRSIYFASNVVPRFDTADFIGPLAVRDIPGAGRGLVTTRTVQAGELLLTCRAIGCAYPDDAESKRVPLVRLNADSGVIAATTQVRAQTNLIHGIVDLGDELALPILGLTAGPRLAPSEYVERPYPLRVVLGSAQSVDAPRLDVDAGYVDGVLRFNAFGPAQSPVRQGDSDAVEPPSELSKSTMPHPLPAILNHACLPNVASIFFSDIVTTRALTELPAGTEIVHQYVRGEEPYAIRASQLSKHGFECACRLCVLDRADAVGAYETRARIIQGEARAVYERSRVLMKRIDAAAIGYCSTDMHSDKHSGMLTSDEDVAAHRDVLDALRQLVSRIEDTYSSNRGKLRPERVPVLLVAIKHVALVEGIEAAVLMCIDAIGSVGAELDPLRDDTHSGVLIELPRLHMDAAIQMLLFIAVLHVNRDKSVPHHTSSLRWTQGAFWGHQCMIGGGKDVFLDRWHNSDFAPALDTWAAQASNA